MILERQLLLFDMAIIDSLKIKCFFKRFSVDGQNENNPFFQREGDAAREDLCDFSDPLAWRADVIS